MSDKFITTCQLLLCLEGNWTGEGRGEFPGVTSFDFRENLAYEQRTQKHYDGGTEYLPPHWESGFLSILEDSGLQIVNIQIGGRSEILLGSVESVNGMF